MYRTLAHGANQRSLRWGIVLSFAILLGGISYAVSSVQGPPLLRAGQHVMRRSHESGRWQRLHTPFSGVRQLVADLEDSSVIYAATDQGLYRSDDGGKTWQRVPTGIRPEPETITAVAAVGDRLFIGTLEGLWLSRDGGKRWQKATNGLPERILPLVIQVAPSHPSTVYVGTERHGIFRSHDGGIHWQAGNRGLPHAVGAAPVTPVEHLLVDPTHEDVVYVATEVNGLYKSTDGGEHWRPINHGLPGLFPYRTYHPLITIDPRSPQTLFAVLGYPVHSHKVENIVYRSTDGGQHWRAIYTLPPNVRFTSLTIDPLNATQLLIGYEGGVVTVSATSPPLPTRRSPRLNEMGTAADMDIGDIAVLQDGDGTLAHLFNLEGQTLDLVLSRGRYRGSVRRLIFDTNLGERLNLRRNDMVPVELPFAFPFFRESFTRINVGSNGNVTLGTLRDRIARPNRSVFASRPRIAVLWDDYDPPAAPEDGGVFVRVETNQVVITWNKVPETNQSDANTFQVVLFRNGTIRMSYLEVDNPTGGLIGVSPGGEDANAIVDVRFEEDAGRTFPGRPVAEFFDGQLDLETIGRRFYASHPDIYDFLVVWGGSAILNGTGFGFAFYRPIQNDARGIGLPVGSFGGSPRAFGSDGRLQGVLNMNSLRFYPSDPHQNVPGLGTNSTLDILGQEAGHRWLAFVEFRDGNRNSNELLGRDFAHWSFFFDSDASEMEGNDWRDNGDGSFTTIAATERYSALDQYVMGLRSAADVADFFFIRNPSRQQTCFDPTMEGRDCPPQLDVTTSGTRVDVSLDQIIQAEGPRVPPAGQAPTSFREAFILVVPEGDERLMDDVEKLDRIRRAWEAFFHEATDGRGTIITRLTDGS